MVMSHNSKKESRINKPTYIYICTIIGCYVVTMLYTRRRIILGRRLSTATDRSGQQCWDRTLAASLSKVGLPRCPSCRMVIRAVTWMHGRREAVEVIFVVGNVLWLIMLWVGE